MRFLRPDEVECRIGTVSKEGKGLSLLLYKDARCDMRILDEEYGLDGWQCEYAEHKGTLFCKVGVLTESGWVWKENAGSPSNMEAQKGEASDAFKRACFLWGIGRELYTAPFIWVKAQDCSISNGKCYDRFRVDSMEVSDGRITQLSISNEKTGRNVYAWDALRRSKALETHSKASTPDDHLQPLRSLMKPYCAARQVDVDQGMREVMDWAGVERMSDIAPDYIPEVEAMMRGVIGGQR